MTENCLRKRFIKEMLSTFLILTLLLGTLGISGIATNQAFASDISAETALNTTIEKYYQDKNKGALKDWGELVAICSAGEDLKKFLLPDTPTSGATAVIVSLIKGDIESASLAAAGLVEDGQLKSSGYAYGDSLNIIAIEAFNRSVADKGYSKINYDQKSAASEILAYQEENGGFGFGKGGDPDTTGICLIALSLYMEDTKVIQAINNAKVFLKNTQQENGGYASDWSGNNANSVAMVIAGMIAVGENPLDEKWQTPKGNTPLDALLSFHVSDGGFGVADNQNADMFATKDAAMALADIKRGESFLKTFKLNSELYFNTKIQVVDKTGIFNEQAFTVTNKENLLSTLARLLMIELESTALAEYNFYIDSTLLEVDAIEQYKLKNNDNILAVHNSFANIAHFKSSAGDSIGVTEDTIPLGGSKELSLIQINLATNEEIYLEGIPIDINGDGYEDLFTDQFGKIIINPIVPVTQVKALKTSYIYDQNWNPTEVVHIADDTAVLPAIINMASGSPQSCDVSIRVEGTIKNLLYYPSFHVQNEGESILTIYDAISQALNNASIPYEGKTYISSVNGETANETSGWLFLYNGDMPMQGMAQIPLDPNSEIVLYYGSYDSGKPDIQTEMINNDLKITFSSHGLGISDIRVYWNDVPVSESSDSHGIVIIKDVLPGTYTMQIEKFIGEIPAVLRLPPGFEITIDEGDASGSVPSTPGDNVRRVFISVVGPQGQILKSKTAYTYSSKLTALDLLRRTGLNIQYNDKSKTYVSSIEGYEEFDYGPASGWLFKVNNDETILSSAAAYLLEPEDYIVWFYTKDFTKEKGSSKWGGATQPQEITEDIPAAWPFADVKEGDSCWYFSAVKYVYEKGIFCGMNANTFGPDKPLTRAMLVSALARMNEVDLHSYKETSFKDVDMDSWYGPSVAWARDAGIISGYANNDGTYSFKPNDMISRQDIAVMINNYSEKISKKTYDEKTKDISFKDISFEDSNFIDDYALSAITSMQQAGIIKGIKNPDGSYHFLPHNNATRAEAATMIYNMYMK